MVNSSAWPLSHDRLAGKAVWKALGDPHGHVAAGGGTNRLRSGEIDGYVLRAAADDLAALSVESLDGCFYSLANVTGVVRPLDFALQVQQACQAAAFLLLWKAVGKSVGRRVGAS
jgi:hypothetical protein